MKNTNLKVEHFRFVSAPENSPAGVVFTPVMGEVEVGRIYPALESQTAVLCTHPQWEAVSKQEYDAQEVSVKQEGNAPSRAPSRNPASVEAGDTTDQGETNGQK